MHLPHNPLLIFVGSRRAGRMVHQERLIERHPSSFSAVKTITTCPEEKHGDGPWFIRTTNEDASKFPIDEMLTFFQEGRSRYFILKREVASIRAKSLIPLVGMSPDGLERLESRSSSIRDLPYLAVILTPADPDQFRDHLILDQGLEPELAVEETRRAIRLSTIPPSMGKSSSIFAVKVHGNNLDAKLVEEAIASLLSPP